jgi:hypothetical protein
MSVASFTLAPLARLAPVVASAAFCHGGALRSGYYQHRGRKGGRSLARQVRRSGVVGDMVSESVTWRVGVEGGRRTTRQLVKTITWIIWMIVIPVTISGECFVQKDSPAGLT